MSAVLNFNQALVATTCIECGVMFAFPQALKSMRLEDGQTFYCPSGHGQVYSKRTSERVRDEMQAKLDIETRRVEFFRREAEMAREAAASTKKKLTSTRSVLTKTRNRIANGVCPCCRRSFANLHAHMSKQHPTYTETGAAEGGIQ